MDVTEAPKPSPRWLCHVCHFSSTEGSGYVCQRCFKIACGAHIVPTAPSEENGITLEMVCVECLQQTEPAVDENRAEKAMSDVEPEGTMDASARGGRNYEKKK
ncbi:MAG: hypothetical protein RBR06_04830 [Desulfuromonadaceae bacterium]|nr:hypothetical protein [Desulfuromonadaceae bacterium]